MCLIWWISCKELWNGIGIRIRVVRREISRLFLLDLLIFIGTRIGVLLVFMCLRFVLRLSLIRMYFLVLMIGMLYGLLGKLLLEILILFSCLLLNLLVLLLLSWRILILSRLMILLICRRLWIT